jgi:hypothetical protein
MTAVATGAGGGLGDAAGGGAKGARTGGMSCAAAIPGNPIANSANNNLKGKPIGDRCIVPPLP